jgi:hypothetical protein
MPRLQHQSGRLFAGKEGRVMAVKIKPAEVPKLEMKLFCLSIVEATERFYKDERNEAAFQKWLKQREVNAGGASA